MADDVTLAIALVGAVTGTAASAAQIYSIVRDRPRLVLGASTHESIHEAPSLTVTISNTGTRPTTVRDVGFFYDVVEFEATRPGEDRPVHHGKGEVGCSIAKGVFLEAGESKDFDATGKVLSLNLHVDQPLRLYAKDMRGRRIWADAVPVVRLLSGPAPDVSALPESERWRFEAPEKRLLPGKVEPAWKLWVKSDLRKPSSWRPPWEK